MTRTVPPAVASRINKAYINDVFAIALEIYTDDMDSSQYIRVINDNANATIESNTYIGMLFDGVLLTDVESEIRSTISVRNADKQIGRAIKAANLEIRCRIMLIDRLTDEIRWDSKTMAVLRNVEADLVNITGEVGPAVSEQEPACFVRAIKSTCPGLFL